MRTSVLVCWIDPAIGISTGFPSLSQPILPLLVTPVSRLPFLLVLTADTITTHTFHYTTIAAILYLSRWPTRPKASSVSVLWMKPTRTLTASAQNRSKQRHAAPTLATIKEERSQSRQSDGLKESWYQTPNQPRRATHNSSKHKREPVWPSGKGARLVSRRTLVRFRFGFPFSSKVVV